VFYCQDVKGFAAGSMKTSSGNQAANKNAKSTSLEEALGILQSGFLKGSGAGFLKGTGEIIKGTSTVSRDIRVGISHVSFTKLP